MNTSKKISEILIAIAFAIGLAFIIYAFIHSWKAGFLWFIATIVILTLFKSILDEKTGLKTNTLSKSAKLILLAVSIFTFYKGYSFLDRNIIVDKPTNKDLVEDTNKKEAEILTSDEIAKIKAIQSHWADSVVKDWKGLYIKRYFLSASLDTIYFQLSKNASKGRGNIDDLNESFYQRSYDSVIGREFNKQFTKLETRILLIPDPEQEKENLYNAERKKQIQRQFSPWDGSNRYLETYLKKSMNDPDSYEHIETTYADKGNYILVQTKFRGTNAFGAKVVQIATAKIDSEGNILEINY